MSRVLWVARILVVLLVIWGISRAVQNALADFSESNFSWSDVRWRWIFVGCSAYFLGLFPMAIFWRSILLSLGQQVPFLTLLRAYFVGHLGKYVPGKAMVIVLRTGLLRDAGVNTAIAAISVFIETMTMMAVGAFLASVTLLVRFRGHQQLQLLAVGLMVGTVLPTLPPVLKLFVRLIKKVDDSTSTALGRYSWPTVAKGWLLCSIGWMFMAGSLWAVLKSMPTTQFPDATTIATTALASVSLAMVAGFFSLLPGGVGVREWVINQLLVPQFGSVVALISAVLLRMLWLVTELVVSAILELWARLGVR